MKRELTVLPHLKIHPDKIITYNQYHWSPEKSKSDNPKIQNLQSSPTYEHLLSSKRSAEGKLSKIAMKKMGLAVDYLVLLAQPKQAHNEFTGKSFQFRMAFITLTLSSKQIHSDNEIKDKCLDSFLIEIGKKYHVKRYVWRAEKQQNGNIHFHILIDKFIAWSELRDVWNRIQNKLKYVDNYRTELKALHKNGFQVRKDLVKKWDEKKQYQAYLKAKKTDFHNPNSTDIHSLKKITNVKAYIKKYISKGHKGSEVDKNEVPEHLKVIGRIWGCSHNLSGIKGLILPVDNDISEVLTAIKDIPQIHAHHDSYFSIYYIDYSDFNNRHTKFIFDLFMKYLHTNFDLPVNYILPLTG